MVIGRQATLVDEKENKIIDLYKHIETTTTYFPYKGKINKIEDENKKKRLYDIALKAVTASKLTKSDRQYIKLNLDHSNKKQFFQIIQDKLMKLKEEHKPLQGTVAGIIPGCEYNLLNQIYTNAQRTYQRKSCDNS